MASISWKRTFPPIISYFHTNMLIRPWKIVCQLKFWFNNFIIFGNWISSFHVHYLWAELMWDFKLYDWENAFLHDSHLWSFWPLWTEWMCFFKSPAINFHMSHICVVLGHMNWINVYFQVSNLRKCLSTWVTFVIFLIIMNWINVSLQVSWLSKWLSTCVTFVLF